MEVVERKRFSINERLRSKRSIEKLFNNGRSFVVYPLRTIYLPISGAEDSTADFAVLISVPKKRIKGAVQRNKIKRLMREAYRLNKHACTYAGETLHIAFMYVSNELVTYTMMEKAMQKSLQKIGQSQET